ncbi:hypothetical protein ASPCADRAFT_7503 [Aspergillus carbonarius ITEM 5010]|uniref:Uncharacterized protein n=1 Tax=Aspergillus carbonarius (strain ITEM 5010) TaxID=602072 RepID=A0A1R3RHQ3_ASPC5|nr:hypothetical protein ASPCADRAFT_7503 [Aspergillus carbonarius ITEM 5010]
MEADYFLTCAGWRTLYRLILYDPHTRRYRVSGVAQHALVSPWAHVEYVAPWDADD